MFDEEPDGDPHGECREEIERLRSLLREVLGQRGFILYSPSELINEVKKELTVDEQ